MPLSKVHRNEVFHAVMAGKLDPAMCDIAFKNDGFDIEHKPTFSTFKANANEGYWFSTLKVGTDQATSPVRGRVWSALLPDVEEWARRVVDWADIPDLWGIVRSGKRIPGELASDSSNSQFTLAEQAAISARLKEIAESIKKMYELTADQSAEIDKKFNEAEKASLRMGRKDWGLMFGGALFSLILADVITPGVAGHILMMVEHGIGHLFVDGPPSVRGFLARGGLLRMG